LVDSPDVAEVEQAALDALQAPRASTAG